MAQTHPLPERLIDIHNHIAATGDPTGVLERMDECGIDTTLILGTPLCSNDYIVRAVADHPGRLVGGAYLDPRQGDGAIEAMKGYRDDGLHVVKLFPNLGYYPDDDTYRPFFDSVAELGMAVLTHCGWLTPAMGVTAAKYSRPGRFETLVRLYPDTIFIFAHMGGIDGFLEAIMLTTRTPNAYVDISPGQGVWTLEYAGDMVKSVPPDRLLFGADTTDVAGCIARQKEALEKLDFGPHFPAIFHDSAHGLLARIGAVPSPQSQEPSPPPSADGPPATG